MSRTETRLGVEHEIKWHGPCPAFRNICQRIRTSWRACRTCIPSVTTLANSNFFYRRSLSRLMINSAPGYLDWFRSYLSIFLDLAAVLKDVNKPSTSEAKARAVHEETVLTCIDTRASDGTSCQLQPGEDQEPIISKRKPLLLCVIQLPNIELFCIVVGWFRIHRILWQHWYKLSHQCKGRLHVSYYAAGACAVNSLLHALLNLQGAVAVRGQSNPKKTSAILCTNSNVEDLHCEKRCSRIVATWGWWLKLWDLRTCFQMVQGDFILHALDTAVCLRNIARHHWTGTSPLYQGPGKSHNIHLNAKQRIRSPKAALQRA